MVALKPLPPQPDPPSGEGSRNAVVALKHDFVIIAGSPESGKQERRGGIETWYVDFHPPGGTPGSRNAVVALKRGGASEDKSVSRPRKQERRGGIETLARNALVTVGFPRKQERRGGIETRGGSSDLPQQLREAGTPWWH